MFSLSFWEIILICSIAIIVLKPEDLPLVAKKIGKFVGYLKSHLKEFTELFDDSGKPKTKTLIADDGLEYEAYDMSDVKTDMQANKAKPKKRATPKKPKKSVSSKASKTLKATTKQKEKKSAGNAKKE